MNSILRNSKRKIDTLCAKHGVQKLYVFGSVLTPRFNEDSDVDFLVDFKKEKIADYFTNFFDFKEALEKAVGRRIDLVEQSAIRNPIFKHRVDNTKQVIYG